MQNELIQIYLSHRNLEITDIPENLLLFNSKIVHDISINNMFQQEVE